MISKLPRDLHERYLHLKPIDRDALDLRVSSNEPSAVLAGDLGLTYGQFDYRIRCTRDIYDATTTIQTAYRYGYEMGYRRRNQEIDEIIETAMRRILNGRGSTKYST